MFNISLKDEALKIHKNVSEEYNNSYEIMSKSSENLYEIRKNSVEIINFMQTVVNSIANTPKEYDTKLGEICKELQKFKETEKYANESYEAALKAGANIAGGAAAGVAVAAMAPTAMMSIATTFGTASTGTAISALSGAAAQNAAVAWIGRTFAGFAVQGGAGMVVGEAFLALAGPIGWTITAGSVGINLISLTDENKKIADDAVEQAKEIAKLRESVDEATAKINSIKFKTQVHYEDMNKQRDKLTQMMNIDFISLSDEDKLFLGSMVNNTLTLSVLLNETIK